MKVDPSISAASATGSTRQSNALDFRQFAALRRGAQENDPKVLREAAKQFEAMFTKMMLESMRKASFGDPMFGSDQGDMYQGMMDDQMAVQLSQGKGLGLADMLIRQLSHGALTGSAPSGSAQTEAPAGNVVDDARKQRFIEQVMPHAQAAARELGVDPRALVAQAALETGWGTSQPADASGASHNLFGIKAGASWRGASVSSQTREYVAGNAGTESARFRSYEDIAESVADYVRVIRDNPRYAAALNTGRDVRAFASALQNGGYATDPAYADKLVAVAERLGLAAPVTPFKSEGPAPITNADPSRKNDA
jgi:flagellar protein FlgJ